MKRNGYITPQRKSSVDDKVNNSHDGEELVAFTLRFQH